MPLVSMGPMLRRARADGYGIAAYNMIDFNSAKSIISGAAELSAPVIVQVSVKTVKHWGYAHVATWVRMLAGDAPVPVALHLDHCTDIDVIKRCIDAGWTSVMFDGSALPFAENLEKSSLVYALTEAAGVGLEAEIGAIGGVEDDKVVNDDQSRLADYDECLRFVAAMPNLAVFAPAIGTAHGFYKGEAKIAYDLLERITKAIDTPIALHGGTGLTDEQFKRCISLGCGKVNISTMHKRLFIDGFVGLKAEKPKLEEPLPFITAQHDAMKADVMACIRTFGSAGRAAEASHAA
ncbi:class II fructose-bisphosphate aldolase [Rhodobacteraceae bacterium HSP-20]|uniref:Class II fructose-bisphosphate aldolase n=1 Tax=Paragemmobacter amnigenus TaxID=2852097 RepID=A0ABS6J7C1_9RHOB|nr:class II fructose-bisphosphate aldolase [Rhodobacter amnigenus]MBU9698744.1 class II fructose-bisphosphate aldolase [Rhodobacter amnigenus]MBV4389971.1 class II fructose-bisphosphate aldolase [Rhodobacter amnigenus]